MSAFDFWRNAAMCLTGLSGSLATCTYSPIARVRDRLDRHEHVVAKELLALRR
jgi:hypothetical protein